MKKLLFVFVTLLVLSGCSGDSDAVHGHGHLSMKIDGVLHEYTNIHIGYEPTTDNSGNPASILYIRAEDDDNTIEYREAFVFRPYRGAIYSNQIFAAAFIINDGVSNENAWSVPYDIPMTCNFTQNDESGIKGTFSGMLQDGVEILNVTEGKMLTGN